MSLWSVWIQPIIKDAEEREHLTLVETARVLGCSFDDVASGTIVPTIRNSEGDMVVAVRSVTDVVAWRGYMRRSGHDLARHPGPLVRVEAARGIQVVYFIRGGPLTKIGTTNDIVRRFGDLRTVSPVPLTVQHLTEGGFELELALHREYASVRHHGEWFDLTRGELSNLKTRYPLPSVMAATARRRRAA